MNKYRNKKIIFGDMVFDSKHEFKRWRELLFLQKANIITDLQRQVPFVIIPKSEHGRAIKYVADFVYTEVGTGKRVVEDAKSDATKTPVYTIKKRLMAEVHGVKIEEV